MPFINDQVSSAKRVVELGIGKRVRSFPSSGRQLFRTVMDVCHDEQMKQKINAIKEMVIKETHLNDVVGSIEELMQS